MRGIKSNGDKALVPDEVQPVEVVPAAVVLPVVGSYYLIEMESAKFEVSKVKRVSVNGDVEHILGWETNFAWNTRKPTHITPSAKDRFRNIFK